MLTLILGYIRLFWTGFFVAISGLVALGVYSGQISIPELREKMALRAFLYAQENPEVVEAIVTRYVAIFGDPSQPTQLPDARQGNTLSALKARQAPQGPATLQIQR